MTIFLAKKTHSLHFRKPGCRFYDPPPELPHFIFILQMFLALILLSVSGTLFQSFNSTLDPADLYWPNAWVQAPVVLSSNHAGASANVTIYYESQVDIPQDPTTQSQSRASVQ